MAKLKRMEWTEHVEMRAIFWGKNSERKCRLKIDGRETLNAS
jgi:hypothetical protein